MTTKPKPSPLLQDHENKTLFQNVGSFCVKQQMIWEQELYSQFAYKTPREYFHTFEADNCLAGMNFASEDEALKFKKAIDEKLQERNKKRQGAPQSAVPVSQSETYYVDIGCNNINNNMSFFLKKGKKKDSKKNLTTADVGEPTDFRHTSHVAWNPMVLFDLEYLDPVIRTLFKLIGEDVKQADKLTVDFILDFVEQNGGIKAVKRNFKKYGIVEDNTPPPLPPKGIPASTWTPRRPPSPPKRPPPSPPHDEVTISAPEESVDLVSTLSSALDTYKKHMYESVDEDDSDTDDKEVTVIDDWDD